MSQSATSPNCKLFGAVCLEIQKLHVLAAATC